jgi:CBS domain containing-hemolysin-like protein
MNRYDRKLQIVYVAIVMSTLIYAVVAWITTEAIVPAKTFSDELQSPLTTGLYAGAALALVAALIIRVRRLLPLRWAMLEAACVCGLIAAIIHGDWRLYAAPWLLALVGLAALFPRVRMGRR